MITIEVEGPSAKYPVTVELYEDGEMHITQPPAIDGERTDLVLFSSEGGRKLMAALDLHFSAIDGELEEVAA